MQEDSAHRDTRLAPHGPRLAVEEREVAVVGDGGAVEDMSAYI